MALEERSSKETMHETQVKTSHFGQCFHFPTWSRHRSSSPSSDIKLAVGHAHPHKDQGRFCLDGSGLQKPG